MWVPFYSIWRRRFRKFGISSFWVVVVGVLLGSLSWFRPRLDETVHDMPWHLGLRRALERLERSTFDARVVALGARAHRSDAVVPVNIDNETLATARESPKFKAAVQPWPRELLGEMTGQLLREGASLVVLDLPMTDVSPHQCAPWGGESFRPLDDERLRRLLDGNESRSLLSFDGSFENDSLTSRELHPYLLSVGVWPTVDDAREMIRRVLTERVPAYAISTEAGTEVWAGAVSEVRAFELGAQLGLKGPPTVRQRLAAEQDHEVTPSHLLASLAAVEVAGLDVRNLPVVRSLEGPTSILLSDKSLYGTRQLVAEADGVVRMVPHLFRYQPTDGPSKVVPSMALAAAMQMAGTGQLKYEEGLLKIGDRFSIPMDKTGHSVIRWDVEEAMDEQKGSLKRSVPAWRLLANLEDHAMARGALHHDNELTGRVVIFSDTTSRTGRLSTTPVGAISSSAVWGQALVNILRSEGIRRAPPHVDLGLIVLLAVIGTILANAMSTILRARSGTLTYVVVWASACGVYWWVASFLMVKHAYWVAVAAPLLAMTGTFLAATGYAAAIERNVRDFIQGALGKQVPVEVARRLQQDVALMLPERRDLTVAFVDLEGFHLLASKLSPTQMGDFLREYFTVLSDEVRETQGQVDKYVGDSLTAFWGAPIRVENHAAAACDALLRMRKAVSSQRESWEKEFGVTIDFHAGADTGQVVVGEMGTRHKANYTVMGSSVSKASQFEQKNREYGTRILVGAETARQASSRFLFREVDSVAGDKSSAVFELLGRAGEISDDESEKLSEYQRGMNAYHAHSFEEALLHFEKAASLGDSVSEIYAERCRKAQSTSAT